MYGGIEYRYKSPYTPQQNGRVERLNRTIKESTATMIYSAKLPMEFWVYAVKCAAHIGNLLPYKGINNLIPYEVLTGKKGNYEN